MNIVGTFFVAFFTLVTSLPSLPLGQNRDSALEEAVWAALKKDEIKKEVVEVVASDGVVVLRGKPRHIYAKMKVIEVVLGVKGVKEVESNLEIAGAESVKEFIKELRKSVINYSRYSVFDDLSFKIPKEGVVFLSGYMTNSDKKEEVEKRVSQVRGVREVNSTIEILPASSNDDDLRENLYRRIYGSSTFEHYRRVANPPIHIIVKRGRVMLTGAVATNLERRRAESLARGTFGVLEFENLLAVNP